MDLQLPTVGSKKIVYFLIVDFHVGDTDKVFPVCSLRHQVTQWVLEPTQEAQLCILSEALSEMEISASGSHLLNMAEDFTHG